MSFLEKIEPVSTVQILEKIETVSTKHCKQISRRRRRPVVIIWVANHAHWDFDAKKMNSAKSSRFEWKERKKRHVTRFVYLR